MESFQALDNLMAPTLITNYQNACFGPPWGNRTTKKIVIQEALVAEAAPNSMDAQRRPRERCQKVG